MFKNIFLAGLLVSGSAMATTSVECLVTTSVGGNHIEPSVFTEFPLTLNTQEKVERTDVVGLVKIPTAVGEITAVLTSGKESIDGKQTLELRLNPSTNSQLNIATAAGTSERAFLAQTKWVNVEGTDEVAEFVSVNCKTKK